MLSDRSGGTMALERVRPDTPAGRAAGEGQVETEMGLTLPGSAETPSDRLASSGVPEGWGGYY